MSEFDQYNMGDWHDRHKIIRTCIDKKKFKTRREARAAIKLQRIVHGKKMRFYSCPYCKSSHLTTIKDKKS